METAAAELVDRALDGWESHRTSGSIVFPEVKVPKHVFADVTMEEIEAARGDPPRNLMLFAAVGVV